MPLSQEVILLEGLLGSFFDNKEATVTILNSSNYGTVHGTSPSSTSYTGGFVGKIYSGSQTKSLSLFIINSPTKAVFLHKTMLVDCSALINTTIIMSTQQSSTVQTKAESVHLFMHMDLQTLSPVSGML